MLTFHLLPSPFEITIGYHAPLLPALFADPVVPSVRALLHFIRRIWNQAHTALLRTSAQNKTIADRKRRPAPTYAPSQQVWLSSKDFPLKSQSKKLSPGVLGPFPIDSVISPSNVVLISVSTLCFMYPRSNQSAPVSCLLVW